MAAAVVVATQVVVWVEVAVMEGIQRFVRVAEQPALAVMAALSVAVGGLVAAEEVTGGLVAAAEVAWGLVAATTAAATAAELQAGSDGRR